MRWRMFAALAVVLGGCGDGGRSGSAATAIAALTSAAATVAGRIDAPADGALVFLVVPDPAATSLAALEDTLVDSAEVAPGGGFSLADAPGAREVLVSAPGRALTRVARGALGATIALAPEARVEVSVTGPDGQVEPLALALVLDPQGRPLPVQADEAVSADDGRLALGRLPAGAWEVLVSSADGERHGRASFIVAAGERARLRVALEPDVELARRFAAAVGVDLPLPPDAAGGAP